MGDYDMLNEWINIHSILKPMDCNLGDSHPDFKRCPNKKGFRVYLDETGHVEDIDVPDFSMESVYRWQAGKKDPAFPVFNGRAFYEVVCEPSLIPLWIRKTLKEKETKKNEKGKSGNNDKATIDESKLGAFLKGCKDLWEEDDLCLVDRCLKDLPIKLQEMLETVEEKPDGYNVFKELIRRTGLSERASFRNEIASVLLQKLKNTRQREYAEVLFTLKKEGKKKGRGKEHGRDFLFLLTIKDWDNPKYGENPFPPYHNSLQVWMAQTFEKYANDLYGQTGNIDAFGLDAAGAEDDHKDVNAAGLGQIKLFAANQDIPCLTRYGRIGAKIFSVGRPARENARKALEYVLHKERKGITWTSLRKYETRNTVAFGYCTGLKDANVIQVFDSDEMEDKENIYVSEEATKTALKTFEGIAESDLNAKVVIGIIAAVDKGNTKILASKQYPLSRYMSRAQDWQKGCDNIPNVILPQLPTKGGKTIKGALTFYPTRAVWLLNSAWRQNGEMIMRKQGKQKVPISKRFVSSDALDFLFEENETVRERLDAGLSAIIEKSVNVLIMACLKTTLDRYKPDNKLKFHNDYSLHMLPTLYGLLLYKKGIRKESYMKENIFNLGRLFAVADRLHILYSKGVRQGDIPLRLIGNDHVSLALQNPQEAFVTLGKRITHPYISWAKRSQDEKTDLGKEIGWCLWDITKYCQLLAETSFPEEIDDSGRAKLILGYLSYGPKSKENGSDNSENNENTKEETL
jgi:hypothetical protein